MTHQLEVNIVYAGEADTWFGHMYVNINTASGVVVATYGFNPVEGYTKYLSQIKGVSITILSEQPCHVARALN